MKRSYFKNKRTPLKAKTGLKTKTKLKKKSITEAAKLKRELMMITKKIIKARDGNVCVTCGAVDLVGRNWHAGHFIRDSTGGVELRYHLDNLHSQCFRCNMILDGNEAEYYIYMVGRYGQEFVDELFRVKNQDTSRWTEVNYRNQIKAYRLIAENEGIQL